jgi:hypothetical protein
MTLPAPDPRTDERGNDARLKTRARGDEGVPREPFGGGYGFTFEL